MGADTVGRQRMLDQVDRAAVDGLLGDDVFALSRNGKDGVGNGCGAGCNGESRNAALQGCDPVFKDALGGVCEAAVDIAGILEAEAVRRVLGVVEDVGRGLVNGNGPRIRCRICCLLAYVQCK